MRGEGLIKSVHQQVKGFPFFFIMGRYTGNCVFDLSPAVSGLLAQGMEVVYTGCQEEKGREDVEDFLPQPGLEDHLDSSLGAIHQLCEMKLRSQMSFFFC